MAGENDYPNALNYPTVAFPQPIPPPEVDPDEGDLIYVGYSLEWQQVLLAACWHLLNPATWQGTDEEIILAQNRAETLRLMLTEPVALDDDVPAPYWDTESNSDDELPAAEQEWYGIFIDPEGFQATMENWVIAGFIAYSGQIGAALTFLTLAPKFRLAWKRGDLGGIIKVFIDGAEAAEVDTYSATPDIIEREFVTDPAEDEHEILMVLDSLPESALEAFAAGEDVESGMMVVRRRLSVDDVGSPDLRWFDDEVQFWNGAEWVAAPDADPRNAPQFRLPSLSDPDARCLAVLRMRAQIEYQVNQAIQFQSAAGIASAFLFGLGLLTVGISVLAGLFLLIADTMLSIGFAAIVTAMTSEVYDQLECILYDHVDANGQIQVEDMAGLRSQVDAEIGGVAAVVLNLMFDAFGAVNLSNAGVVRSETGECDCDPMVMVSPAGYGTTEYLGGGLYRTTAQSFNDGGTTRWRTSAHREDASLPCATAPKWIFYSLSPASGYYITGYGRADCVVINPGLPSNGQSLWYLYTVRNAPYSVEFYAAPDDP